MAVGGKVVDELVPFPVKDQLPGVDFCVTSCPSWGEAVLLGFQHYLVMLGTTVIIPSILVPLMGGGNVEKAELINTMLFVAGINTLIQSLFGCRLPVVIGGSYAFIIPSISIALRNSTRGSFGLLNPHQRFEQSMRALQGALIIASLLQMVIGFFGFWRVFARFLSPVAAVPLVTLTGLGLYAHGFPQLAKCIEIGLPALIIVVLLSQFVPHLMKSKGPVIGRYAVIFSVAIVWAFAEILTVARAYDNKSPNTQFSCRTDRSGLLGASPWIRVPYPFQWGKPTFRAGDIFAMMAACFVAIVESTGTIIAASRYGSATHIPPSVLSRGIGWMGLGSLLGGAFGTGSGASASVENAGLLGLTRVGSRRVIQISAGFMLFFSVLGKFGAVLASIPLPIVAALYCVLFAYVGMYCRHYILVIWIYKFINNFRNPVGFWVSIPLFCSNFGIKVLHPCPMENFLGHSHSHQDGSLVGTRNQCPLTALTYGNSMKIWLDFDVLVGYAASAGLGYLQFCNLNSFRTKFILGFSLFLGLSVPQYFNEYLLIAGYGPVHTRSIWFNNIIQVIFSSPATVAIIVAYSIDISHSLKHTTTRRDSGRHWWRKFRTYDQDIRTEEFYSLPYNLNRFFPSF